MWKDYSSGYLKNNRSSGLAVIVAAFISALLLSLLSGLFYNAPLDDLKNDEITKKREK